MRTLRIVIAALLLPSCAYAQRVTRPASTDPWEVTELTNRPSLTLELLYRAHTRAECAHCLRDDRAVSR